LSRPGYIFYPAETPAAVGSAAGHAWLEDVVASVGSKDRPLGVVFSSRRYKEDVQDMGESSSGLVRSGPVTFRYQKPYEDASKPL
jgi:hypothetical protein